MKVTSTEFADLFAISLQTVKVWTREGLPKERAGRRVFFPLRECIRWVRENRPIEAKGENTLAEARRRRAFAQARLAEFEAALKEGTLIPKEDVLEAFLNRIHMVRSGLLLLPRSLPGRLSGKDPREAGGIIKRETYRLLSRFSRKGGPLK